LSRGPDRLGRRTASSVSSFPVLLVYLSLLAGLFFIVGCKKISAPPNGAGIRNITRELVLAARNASHGRAEVEMRPELVPSQSGKERALAYDHVYITIPVTKTGGPDRATRDAVESELAHVAELHHLQRVTRSGAPGLERFDYLLAGRRTHSVHLIMPLAKDETTSTSPSFPRLAVVIDDLGNDRAQADAVFRLPYALTVSVLPHEPNSVEIAEEAHLQGYEVMLHLPVASNAGNKDEPIELHPGMDTATVEKTLTAMLDTVPYASGVNNHEGSLGTSDAALMGELMPLLHQRNLFFIDSRTTAATVAEAAAHAAGVPAASRNVFLDDQQSAPAIRKQFELAIRDAREKRSALAIGHPHPETLRVLSEVLPEAKRQGVRLVFASDLAR